MPKKRKFYKANPELKITFLFTPAILQFTNNNWLIHQKYSYVIS